MNDVSEDVLEVRAADQRTRLHSSVVELKSRVREKLDVKRTARAHLGVASGLAVFTAFMLGYGFAGIFTRR
jgi:hypothetical protein